METVALPVGATGLQYPLYFIKMGLLFKLAVKNVFAAKSAVFFELDPFRMLFLILRRTVIDTLAFRALKLNGFTHNFEYLILISHNIFLSTSFKVAISEDEAPDRYRTGDLVLTKDVLYRLSYRGSAHTLPKKFPDLFFGTCFYVVKFEKPATR